jgi:hypothetical protein
MTSRAVIAVRRWQVVAAFVLLIGASAVVIVWEDGRIDANARRSARAEAKAVAAQRVNVVQNDLRHELVQAAHNADVRLCQEIESIKERIRATVAVDDEQFLASLAQIGLQPTSTQALSLLAEAHEREADTLERFAPLNCRALGLG